MFELLNLIISTHTILKVYLNYKKGSDKVVKTVKKSSESIAVPNRPPLSPEAWENRLIGKAMAEVERRIDDHTATSQELVHFLKLGTEKAKLENRKLEQEVELARAKTEALESSKHIEELYANAINAMKEYSGALGGSDDYEDDEYVY